MSPKFRRAVAQALVAWLCVAVFVLTWVAGWQVSLFLLVIGAVCVAGAYWVWRRLPSTNTEADRMAREAEKNSGRHPAGRGRVTDPTDAAWSDNSSMFTEPDSDLLAKPNPERVTSEPMDPLLRDLAREWSKRYKPANRELARVLRKFNDGVISR